MPRSVQADGPRSCGCLRARSKRQANEETPPGRRRQRSKKLPVPTVSERTPEGRFPRGISGNVAGRPRGARGVFSEQMIYDFAHDWHKHGPSVLVAVRTENPMAYLTVAAKFLPKELLLQLERPVEQLSDADLAAAAKAERDMSVLVLAKVRALPGGDDLVAEAERDIFNEDTDDE